MLEWRDWSAAVSSSGIVPLPGAGTQVAVVPEGSVVPYSNLHSSTSAPLGLTVAFSVALVWVIELAGSALTVGGPPEIGRASCRERVPITVVAVSFQEKD